MSPARNPEDNFIDVVGGGDELDTLLLSDMRRNGQWVYKELILSLGEAASPRDFVGIRRLF
jgi:hypothetical protein